MESERRTAMVEDLAAEFETRSVRTDCLGVNYGRLDVYLRAKLVCRVWPLIWWISGGFRLPGGVATDILGRFDINSNLICLASVRFDTILTLFCHPFC